MQVAAVSPKEMYILLLTIGIAWSSRTSARSSPPVNVPPALWRTAGAPNAASGCRDVHGCPNVAQDLGLQLPGRPRVLLQVGAGALTAGAGDASGLNAGVQLSGQGPQISNPPPAATQSLGPQLPSASMPAASVPGDQPPGIMLPPINAAGATKPAAAGAQIGASGGGAQNQGSGSSTGPGASLMMGPQAGAAVNAQSTLGTVGASLPGAGAGAPGQISPVKAQSTLGAVGASLPGAGAGVPGQIISAPPPPLNEGMQAGFNGSQNQLSVGAAGPSAGQHSALGQNSTPGASDDDEDDGSASPASGPESILGGIYEGVPAGGPSEPLIDDGTEGAGPSAAPPVTDQDMYASYAALILGTGD